MGDVLCTHTHHPSNITTCKARRRHLAVFVDPTLTIPSVQWNKGEVFKIAQEASKETKPNLEENKIPWQNTNEAYE
ncbi:hypothetical protein Y032_0910g3003 [Ancylostoma ceylanicum]|uniref:Uncharacterized protein n=1 Tax=Ancylostoma ceylanicum TaxID=53326 RepID=A0A016WBA9_9BILA|nr:hypothetical protein Y032_0910g3003 [Ancylostoma ceylanicum]